MSKRKYLKSFGPRRKRCQKKRGDRLRTWTFCRPEDCREAQRVQSPVSQSWEKAQPSHSKLPKKQTHRRLF
jgi:hypothetical protein